MKLSTRTKYGIRAILELAKTDRRHPLQLGIIAKHQDISAKYLEQIMGLLKSAGLVSSIRGAKGGYILARHNISPTIKFIFVFVTVLLPV